MNLTGRTSKCPTRFREGQLLKLAWPGIAFVGSMGSWAWRSGSIWITDGHCRQRQGSDQVRMNMLYLGG